MPSRTKPRPKTRSATRPASRRGKRRRHVTPEDLARYTYVADPQIAPDGSTVVFVHKTVGTKNQYVRNLWIVPTDGGAPRPFTSGGKDHQPRWSADGRRIAFVGEREKSRAQIYVIDADGGEAVALTAFPEGSIGRLRWSPDGTMIAVAFRERDPEWTEAAKKERDERGSSDPPRVLDHWWYRLDGDGYFNHQRYHILLIDTETGEGRTVYAKDTLGFFSFDFSPDSKQLVISSNPDRRAGLEAWNDQLLRMNIASGRVTPIPGLPRGPKDAVAWSPDGRWIAYAGREGTDGTYSTENLELWICDPVKGKPRRLTGKEDYCLMSAPITDTGEVNFNPVFHWSRDSRRINLQIGWQGASHWASVRPVGGAIAFHTSDPAAHGLGNSASDGSVAMTVGTPTRLDEIHIARLRGDRATTTALTNFNKAILDELMVSRPKSHWITSSDGTRVQLWVMLPPGAKQGRKHPTVLEIHGGPHTQYGECYFHEFQVLAGQGYAVVYSNPRGSKGYGRDHCAAIRGRWGHADWIDVQAVIEYMKAKPSLDTKRLGVMGGSYGGYMTNWVIGHCRDFAAAITDRCVSNIVSMGGTSDFLDPPDQYFPGNSWDRTELRWEQSPMRHIGKARTPTLIIHSEGDLRCNIEQAEQLFAALNLRRVPTRFIRYPASTSHGLSRSGPPDLRIHRLHQILEWWKKYL